MADGHKGPALAGGRGPWSTGAVAYSESVYLDCVAPDGRTAFVTRLALHPDVGGSWLWTHLFLPDGRAFAYNRQDLSPAPPGAPSGLYALPGGEGRFERRKDGAVVHIDIRAHGGVSAPEGDGGHRLILDAQFAAVGGSGSNLPGRSERLGRVDAVAVVDGEELRLSGLGQFHEQHQDGPRFTVPFTYGSLRGDGVGAVFLVGPRRSGGFLVTGGTVRTAGRVGIEPPAHHRALRMTMDDGVVAGEITRTWDYQVPINGRMRTSSVVTGVLDGRPVSGCVNDWEPAAG